MRAWVVLTVILSCVWAPQALADRQSDKAKVQAILDATPGAAEVWTLRDDGVLVHKLSGHICPPSFSNVGLERLIISGSAEDRGGSVDCNYARGLCPRPAVSTLDISFVRAGENDKLDAVFARYQKAVYDAMPSAKALGPAMKDGLEGSPIFARGPFFRSEEYDVVIPNHRPLRVTTIVSLVNGWVIAVRSAYILDKDNESIDSPGAINAWSVATGVGVP